ncbi:MAG: glycosyltransferase family 2 protein [Cyclobacteriaceae bacterium]|nr:MAG: glycosyltransferase family 2 protein [Cyclobacteriaceae bacterium]
MEYLFINNPSEVDWGLAKDLNLKDDLCIVQDNLRPQLDLTKIESAFMADVAHAGLHFYKPGTFKKLSLATLNWFFLSPAPNTRTNAWMASFHVMVLKRGVLEKLNLEVKYNTAHFLAADLAFQVLRSGGLVVHQPDLIQQVNVLHNGQLTVDSTDLRRFILRFFGKRAALIAFPLSWFSILKSKDRRINYELNSDSHHLLLQHKNKTITSYSAVIPTINRYAYLKKAIYSLLQKDHPPAEIIVVDQTPERDRVAGYYDEFKAMPVKVFFIETAGQSTARNYAVHRVTSEWILFFDDDSETWADMVKEHIYLLEHSLADVSTGISLAPWKDKSHIPDFINYYHIASVLDTGNCMMRKSLVEEAGLFDLAFDKGSGADDNLGKRLFLKGAVIVFNPKAIRTHHKAPMGGLRTHGAWWKNKGTYFGPFPLPTESYDFMRFYPRAFYLRLCMYRLITSYRRSGLAMNIINTILFPVKVLVSYRKAQALLKTGLRN